MKLKDLNPTDEKSLIEFGNDFFEESAEHKRKLERQWLLNILFIIGEQLCNVSYATGQIIRVDPTTDPDWKIRVINNRIMPIYRTMVAKLTKGKPIPMSYANSAEDKDIQAARAVSKLMSNHWTTLGLDKKILEMAGWLVSTGNVFTKQFYNPKKGKLIKIDESIKEHVQNLIEEQFAGALTEDKLKKFITKIQEGNLATGDTDLMLRNPFNCYPQKGKTRIEDMTMFGDSEYLTEDEVFDKYGIETSAEAVNKTNDRYIYNMSIGDIIDTGELKLDGDSTLIEVRELAILPNRKFPKGARFKWVGNELVGEEDEEKVQECYDLGVEHFGLIRVPGKFWCESIIDDLIPMQTRWNELLSKIEMHNDLYNDPPIIIDPNVIDIDEWVAQPGLLIEKKITGPMGEPPHVMEVPPLDQAIFQELNILDKQFEIVPILNKVSFGKDTPNARSGLAINYLQEKDDDVIRPLINEIETSFTGVFKRDFRLCKKHYTEDRGFAIVGANNRPEWIEFEKAHLDANIDVCIEPGSAMPKSIAAQQAMVLELMDRGFFFNPQTQTIDYPRIARYMEFGGINEMYEDLTIDSDHAKRTIIKLKSGQQVQIQDWYNLPAHLTEINKFRKTTEYEELPIELMMNIDAYAKQCQMILNQPLPQPEVPVPTESMNFKDLPPEGKIQMAEKVGIHLTPESVQTPPPSSSQSGVAQPSGAALPMLPAAPTTPAVTVSPVEPVKEESPVRDEAQINAVMSRLRVISPDTYRKIKDMDPVQSAGMIDSLISQVSKLAEDKTKGNNQS